MAKTPRKPLDAGFKRTLKIVGLAVGASTAAMIFMTYTSSSKSTDIQQASNIGNVVGRGNGPTEGEMSETTRQKLARVHEEEAKEAQRAGRAYIPEMIFGEPVPVEQPTQQAEAAPEPDVDLDRPPVNRHAGAQLRPSIEDEARQAQLAEIQAGLISQMQMLAAGMQPATTTPVSITFDPLQGQRERAEAEIRAQVQAEQAAANQPGQAGVELVGGDEIVAAILTTPVNTDKSSFAMAEIVGGPLSGAQLRGQVVPMNMSGDIEDVGIRFSSMRFDGKHYSIDAIALNEQTASDAMDGKVDRRIFSRYVMPIVMAGMSGASTYFTARGTPAMSVAAGDGYGGDALIVEQERADRKDAINQGIGDAIDKTVQTADREVQRQANRPNRVELSTYTPIGVIFNSAVLAN